MNKGKSILFGVMCLVLFSTTINAKGYFCLFLDEDKTSWCVENLAVNDQFTVWVFIIADHMEVIGADFGYVEPPNVLRIGSSTTIEATCHHTAALDDCDIDYGSISFSECKTGMFWVYQVTYLLTSLSASRIEIIPSVDAGGLFLTTCGDGYPQRDATILNHIYLNDCGPIATEATTWGVIKNMYDTK